MHNHGHRNAKGLYEWKEKINEQLEAKKEIDIDMKRLDDYGEIRKDIFRIHINNSLFYKKLGKYPKVMDLFQQVGFRKVSHELNLKNTKIINKTIIKKNELGRFDVITSRAFATIEKTINLTETNAHKNTKYLLLKGKASNIEKELKDIDKNMFRYEIINQDTTKERNIVLLCKDE